MADYDVDSLTQTEMKWTSWALRAWLVSGLSFAVFAFGASLQTRGDMYLLNGVFQVLLFIVALPGLWGGLMVSTMAHHSALLVAVPLEEKGDYFRVSFHKRGRLLAGATLGLVSLAGVAFVVLDQLFIL